MPFLTWIRY